ncbi:MAG: hypothetical protein RIQ89_2375 [Bacteroidota bacterium]
MNQSNSFSMMPVVTKNLLIINGIFFLADALLSNKGIVLSDILGLHYFAATDFRPFQLITYMFMHGNFMHLFFNMLGVWMFGTAVENYLGSKKFLIYYLVTGLGAAALHYAIVHVELQPILAGFNDFIQQPTPEKLHSLLKSETFKTFYSPEMRQQLSSFIEGYNHKIETNPMEAMSFAATEMATIKELALNAPVVVGASGSLFGLLLAFGMLFPNSIVYLYFAIPIKAKYFVILYGVIELFSGVANIPGDNVAHFAHLGGFITGLILMLFWRKKTGNFFKPYDY